MRRAFPFHRKACDGGADYCFAEATRRGAASRWSPWRQASDSGVFWSEAVFFLVGSPFLVYNTQAGFCNQLFSVFALGVFGGCHLNGELQRAFLEVRLSGLAHD